jgi:hypothetical protein
MSHIVDSIQYQYLRNFGFFELEYFRGSASGPGSGQVKMYELRKWTRT